MSDRSSLLSLLVALVTVLAGCQSLDELATGRTDRLDDPPFVVRYESLPGGGRVTILGPVAVDGDTRLEIFGDGRDAALEPLAEALTRRLRDMTCCTLVAPGLDPEGEPTLYVGSAEGETAPEHAAELRYEWDKYPPMVTHVEQGAASWRSGVSAMGPGPFLLVRLAIADYPKSDEGLFGKKLVLGAGHEEPLRFVSAEMAPVQVLQVTGMLLDGSGRVVAAGAEGIHGLDSPFWVQIFEARKEIDPELLGKILSSERRKDLPGRPLKWEAALDALVDELVYR